MWTPSGTRQKAWSRRAEKRERARDGDFPASTPLKRAEFLKGHGSEIDGEAKSFAIKANTAKKLGLSHVLPWTGSGTRSGVTRTLAASSSDSMANNQNLRMLVA